MPLVVGIALLLFLVALGSGSMPLLGKWRASEKRLSVMTALAAGFLISSAFMVAIPEGLELSFSDQHSHALHHREYWGMGPNQIAGAAVLVGFGLMLALELMGFGHDIHEEHHGAGPEHVHHPAASQLTQARWPLTIVIGLTFHAFADGLAVGAALASELSGLTLSVVVALSMHKIPAAFSLSIFSLHTRDSARATYRDLIGFAGATPMALLVSWFLFGYIDMFWISVVLMLSAGMFIYIAAVDVLPNVIRGHYGRTIALQMLAGSLVMAVLLALVD